VECNRDRPSSPTVASCPLNPRASISQARCSGITRSARRSWGELMLTSGNPLDRASVVTVTLQSIALN
jgi:hypothetical protein